MAADLRKNWNLGKKLLKIILYSIIVTSSIVTAGLHIKMHNEIFGGYSNLRVDLIKYTKEIATTIVREQMHTLIRQMADKSKSGLNDEGD